MPQRTEQPRTETQAQARTETQPRTQAQATQQDWNTRSELPRTASLLPLLAILGLGSLAGSQWLRRRSRRTRR